MLIYIDNDGLAKETLHYITGLVKYQNGLAE